MFKAALIRSLIFSIRLSFASRLEFGRSVSSCHFSGFTFFPASLKTLKCFSKDENAAVFVPYRHMHKANFLSLGMTNFRQTAL